MKSTESQNRFNSPDSLLVISSYPSKNTTHTGGGLASYTKNTLKAIKKFNPKQKIVVLANIIDTPEVYTEKNILVIRCWERSFLKLYPSLLTHLYRFNKITKILFGFEFSAYGDILTTAFIPGLLGIQRLSGKNTVSVIHQITSQLTDLAVHTGLSKKPGSISFYNIALTVFYQLIGLVSQKIVTLEEELTSRFNSLVPGNKAVTLPHGLYTKKPLKRKESLKKLNLDPNNLYVLAFGYLSHYKGSDLLIDAFKKPITINGKKVCLILAGGENPTQGQKHHYRHFYEKLYSQIDDNSSIIHTGFVPDKRIKTYFSASDLVIFPYRAFMSASGPLSLALSYKKPFLTSSKLSNYTKYIFENDPLSIRRAIKTTLKNKHILSTMIKFSRTISLDRDFDSQGEKYLRLFEEIPAVSSKLATSK